MPAATFTQEELAHLRNLRHAFLRRHGITPHAHLSREQ
jgi:hypothetical protein